MPHSARSLPPDKRHSRLTIVRRGCNRCRIAGIHGEAMYTAPDYPQGVCHIRKAAELPTAVQCAARAALQDKNCQCAGSRGKAPCVLLGDLKGAILSRERMAPFIRSPAVTQGNMCSASRCDRIFPYGENNQPGGQVMSRPESTWKCRCGTLCPACSPMLDTTR